MKINICTRFSLRDRNKNRVIDSGGGMCGLENGKFSDGLDIFIYFIL